MISPAVNPSIGTALKITPSFSPSKCEAVPEDLVIALHDFPSTPPSTNRYLSFKAGQLIRVINRDKSGWWDGEMMLTPIVNPPATDHLSRTRGWFPSNYVTNISNSNIASFEPTHTPASTRRPSVSSMHSAASFSNEVFADSPASLLTPSFHEGYSVSLSNSRSSIGTPSLLLQDQGSSETDHCKFLWDPIVQAMRTIYSQAQHPSALTIQTATADIISAVRTVLDSTGCLARDSPVLCPYPHLIRERKQLLSALACLVDKARKILPASPNSSYFPDTPSSNLQPARHEERRVILQLAHQVLSHVRSFLVVAQRCSIKFNVESTTKQEEAIGSLSIQRTMSLITPILSHDSARPLRSRKSVANLGHRTSRESLRNKPSLKSIKVKPAVQHRRIDSGHSYRSITSNRPSATSTIFTAGQMLDMTEKSHDQVLSTVAVFIGHAHIHSSAAHPASHAHLIDMTRDVIENVCEMLVMVECISKNRDIRSSEQSRQDSPLVEAREALYVSTTSLVTAARVATSGSTDVSSASGSTHEDEEADPLLASATAVLRAANGCMDAVSECLSAVDPAHGEFHVPSSRPSVNTSLSEDSCLEPPELAEGDSSEGLVSQRTRHTLSMLGRKANSLALPRNPFESETRLAWSSDWHREGSPVDLSDAGSMYSCETPFIVREKSIKGKIPHSPSLSPSLSARSSSDGIEFVRRSISSATSSNGGYSRESSPATSTSISYPEHDSFHRKDKRNTLRLGFKHSSIDFSQPPLHPQIEPETSPSQDSWQQELLLNNDNQVIGGTLRGLVGRMTSHDTPVEASFFHSFFMTFRLFTNPEELANALIARFALTFVSQASTNEHKPTNNLGKVTPIRLRVYNVMKSWLELHWRMKHDESVLPLISKWAETLLSTVLPVPAERLVDLINKRMKESQMGIQPAGIQARIKVKQILGSSGDENSGKLPCPTPIISKALMSQFRASSLSLAGLQLTEFDPTELARQITIMESKLFGAIQSEEIFDQIFNKNSGLAVNVRAMSVMSTRMTGWFTEAILNEDDLRKRTQTLKFLIKLGAKLLEMQNYNALMSLMSSLNSSTILRLKKTWEGVGNKARGLFENLNKAVSHQRNYAEYRATLRNAQTPCIPFLGVYLTDLTFCHEGNPTHRISRDLPGVKLINFDKYQKIMKIMNEIERFQVPFNFAKVPQIVAYIRSSMENLVYQASADNLYQRSLKIEPRDSS